ncbi:MAG: hypothetical protein HZC40_24570 [Chloroflexi bacterium]|nr:hypothetical protein [Chloroflexota bacterium]
MEPSLQIALDNYAYGIREVIPQYITGKLKDREALEDEFALILRARDQIESALEHWRVREPHAAKLVDELDRVFLLSCDPLVKIAPVLSFFREGKQIPRSRWWYYLDLITRVQIEEFVLPSGAWDETMVLPERIIVRQFALAKE